MATTSFSVNFDYRCPFARNANEHLIAALEDGAPFDVSFKGFSLDQPHVAPGRPSVWQDEARRPEQVAVAAGIVVRDRYPEQFLKAHLSLFAARHDDGNDLRDEKIIRNALERAGVNANAVYSELEAGWPFETFQFEHERSVIEHEVWGVPTFIAGSEAVFIRLMSRPKGDAVLARQTIDSVIGLLFEHPEVNEYKHTSISM